MRSKAVQTERLGPVVHTVWDIDTTCAFYRVPGLAMSLLLLLGLTACVRPINPTPTLPTAQVAPVDALVIRNGTALAGGDAIPVPNAVVIIQGDHILAMGRAADWIIPPGARVIDAQGGAILPGIIDSHVSATYDAFVRRLFLTEGVTAICDLSPPLSALPTLAQESADSGPAARGFHAGPIITAPGGYPASDVKAELRCEVSNAAEARAAVQDQVGRGVDVITIALDPGDAGQPLPILDLDTAKAAVDEAHRNGRPVRALVPQAATLDTALAAGVDAIEGVPLPQPAPLEIQATQQNVQAPALPDSLQTQLAQAVARGIILVPALDMSTATNCGRQDWSADQKQFCLDQYLQIVRRFHDLGGQIALGNDYSADPNVQPGMPLQEMKLLQAAGLSTQEIIQAATVRAAQVCGHRELGVLAPGKTADIIIVAGNPLADLQTLSRVQTVIQDGQVAFQK